MNRLVVHVDQLNGKILGTLDVVKDGLSQIREMQSWEHIREIMQENNVLKENLCIEPETTDRCNAKWGNED